MKCKLCGGDAAVINAHWKDPLVECSCMEHMMRLSELERVNDSDEEFQAND